MRSYRLHVIVMLLVFALALPEIGSACTVTHSARIHAEFITYSPGASEAIYSGPTTFVVWNFTIENFTYYELFKNMSEVLGSPLVNASFWTGAWQNITPYMWCHWLLDVSNRAVYFFFNLTPTWYYLYHNRTFCGTFMLPFTNVTVGGTVVRNETVTVGTNRYNVTVVYEVVDVAFDIELFNLTMSLFRDFLAAKWVLADLMAQYYAELYNITYASAFNAMTDLEPQFWDNFENYYNVTTEGHALEMRQTYNNVTDCLKKLITLDWLEWNLRKWSLSASTVTYTYFDPETNTTYNLVGPAYDLSYSTTVVIEDIDPVVRMSLGSPENTVNVTTDGSIVTFTVWKVKDVSAPVEEQEPHQEEEEETQPPAELPEEEQEPQQTEEQPAGEEAPSPPRTYWVPIAVLSAAATLIVASVILLRRRGKSA